MSVCCPHFPFTILPQATVKTGVVVLPHNLSCINISNIIITFFTILQGLGKKKVDSNHKSKFVPDFIAWVPHKKEINASGPLESVYKDTYRESESERTSYPQILVNTIPKPKAVIDVGSLTTAKSVPYSDPVSIEDMASPITTYQFAHRHMQPNRSIFTNMNTGQVETTPLPPQITPTYINPQVPSVYERPKTALTRLRRARISSAPNLRSSVAACLRWFDADDDNEMRPKTASGCFPELSQTGGDTQILTLHGSNSVPSLSTTQLVNNNYDTMKTSRIPATQIVPSTDFSNNNTTSAPVAMEEG